MMCTNCKTPQQILHGRRRLQREAVLISPTQKRDKQTCRYVHGFKKTFSRIFFFFLVTGNAVP